MAGSGGSGGRGEIRLGFSPAARVDGNRAEAQWAEAQGFDIGKRIRERVDRTDKTYGFITCRRKTMKFVFLACFSGLYTFPSNRLITYFGIISSIENAVNKYLNIASKINLV